MRARGCARLQLREPGATAGAPPRRRRRPTATDREQASAVRRVVTDVSGHDFASGVRDDRPGLDSCLRALRQGDVLVVWKLDRLGRNLAHLVNTVQDLSARGVGLRVLTGEGAQVDTTTAAGRLVFGIFAALAEFERELIRERTVAGLKAARARGRKGGRKFALSKAQVRLAQAAMAHRDTSVSELCRELGIRPVKTTDEARRCIHYLVRNRRRMRYPRFRARGLCISSGVVEAGCKHTVGTWLKRAGMRWTVAGANAIIALRCCKLSGRFEDFWERRAANAA